VSALYYEAHGSGRDVVLLHDLGVNLRVWDYLVRELAAHFRLIALDLPGHGRSDWDPRASTPEAQAWRVHETLATLTGSYALVGWSLGGQLAIDLAAALPAGISRLVLIATTPRFLAAPGWRCGAPRPLLARLLHRLHTEGERVMDEFLALQARGSAPRTAERVLSELREAVRTHGTARLDALVSGLARLRDGDLRRSLALLRMPALIIAGQRDRLVRPAAARALAAALPDARYVQIAGAAHAPFLSHPTQCAKVLAEFLRA